MKAFKLKFTALILIVTILFTGCSTYNSNLENYDEQIGHLIIKFEDMEYSRPDMDKIYDSYMHACDIANESTDFYEVEEGVYLFFDAYDVFYTYYNMAYIKYCSNMTDEYWTEEYNYCASNATTVDSYLDELYRVLAKSDFRDEFESEDYFGAGWFDAYEGDSVMDEGYLALAEQETTLVEDYYKLMEEASSSNLYGDAYYDAYANQFLELYIELIKVRQDIAEYVGYSNYAYLAYESYYYRDYTPGEVERYLNQVSENLSDDYEKICSANVWALISSYCSDAHTFQYVKDTTDAMGGIFQDGFRLLEKGNLYDIKYDENKCELSFEANLWIYTEPYIFLRPYLNQTDKLTFAHEFGHFLNDYACVGSYAGTDVAEVHSQAFEYLSLCYATDTEKLTQYKMIDSLCTYVETGAYSLFELQVYSLPEEELTVENILAIYEEIGTDFGFTAREWDTREIIGIPHLFAYPMYMISYVVSNDLAMQFYQLELEEQGKGLELYEECLYSQDTFIINFAETYDLESPFANGRVEKINETFESILQ